MNVFQNESLGLPPLSFVYVNGFGPNPIPVQVSTDGKFLIISTYYKLTPLIATSFNTGEYIGEYSDIIGFNRDVFKELINKVADKSNEPDSRIKTTDPLLLVRAFVHLRDKFNLQSEKLVLTDEDYELALTDAIAQDDSIKNLHYNVIQALKKVQNS